MRLTSGPLALAALLVACGGLAACTGADEPERRPAKEGAGRATEPLDPGVSLTDAGRQLYRRSDPQEDPRPRYDISAVVEPDTGDVHGTATVTVPVLGEEPLTFRFFPGLPDFEAEPRLGDVMVDGQTVEATLDSSIISVPLPQATDDAATVEIPFGYRLPERDSAGALDGLLGQAMTPADIGLLAHHPDALSLGHWMPLWIPEGRSAEPVPAGFGDIGNFAASEFRVSLEVPEEWSVVDGGTRTGESTADGRTTVTSEGVGMRDFVVSVLRGYETRTRELDGDLAGVTISATAPAAQVDVLDGVLDETETAMRTLSAAYGDYPWREFDVVSAPLGASVGGMEWPGATWIESGLFGGGIPGLGALGELDLGGLGLDDGALTDLLGGETATMLDSMRAWTIAHETAHSWWTVVVGNDSVLDPVVDEPLAQYASCLVLRESRADGDAACRAQIGAGYEQMRLLGEPDAPADQATDEFASSTQYAGVVYGKAAEFYLHLEERYGVERLTAALRELVLRHAFQTVTGAEVEAVLVDELGPEASRLWTRWMERTRGDQDLRTAEQPGLTGLDGIEGLEGLEGLTDEELQQLLDQLLSALAEQS